MNINITRFIIVLLMCAVTGIPAAAGPVFDDLLNYPVIDQVCCEDARKSEGMGLAVQGKAQFIALTKEQPLGQTFVTGAEADVLWRVLTGICHWPDSFQEGEAITFTLWDSPAKTKKLYERTIEFEHKWYKWDTPFDVQIPNKPGTSYYFEFTHNGGGNNSINIARTMGNDYQQGQAYVGGKPSDEFDLYFVTVSKHTGDRTANLKKFLDQFDYTRPELAEAGKAVEKGDLDGACALVLRAFEDLLNKSGFAWKPAPDYKPNTADADAVCDEGKLFWHIDKRDAWIRMDKETTWREVWPEQSDMVRQNDVFSDLGSAYAYTKNEKYARKLDEMMRDYMQDNASPFDGGTWGGRWGAMNVAWRLGDAWPCLARTFDARELSDDTRLGWINYWCRMSYFARTEHSGGNHANAVAEAMMGFTKNFPLFKDAKTCFEFGYDKMVSNSLTLFREDGGCVEPAMNYHGFSLVNLMGGIETAQGFGMGIPDELSKKLEKALAYTAYMLKPDGQIPSYGDTGCEEFRPGIDKWNGWREGEALEGWKRFGRKDLLYIATAGKEGVRPEFNSYSFPNTRHYIMRSDWGGEGGKDFEQARYLFFRGGSMGSHGHWDMNQVTLYAYGRPLIIDPGRTEYDSPLMPVLKSSPSHNVLLVDGKEMQRKDVELKAWHATPVIDFVDNYYTELYPGTSHRRAVIFVRPDYYVMFDTAVSQSPQKMGINFWLTPPDLQIDRAAGFTCTTEPNGSNILLKCFDMTGVELADRKGTTDHDGNVRDDMPVVTYWQKDTTHADFATLLYPFPGKASDVNTSVIKDANGWICIVDAGAGKDYICYSPEGKLTAGKQASFEARAALVRTDNNGKTTCFGMLEGKKVTYGGIVLATSEEPVSELSVTYLPDRVEVTCPQGNPSLRITSLGRKVAVVNGREMKVAGSRFTPFE